MTYVDPDEGWPYPDTDGLPLGMHVEEPTEEDEYLDAYEAIAEPDEFQFDPDLDALGG